MSKLPTNTAATLTCGRFVLSLRKPLVMGIVNVTPDSFQAEGRYAHADSAIAHAHRLIEEGADILDIGAESTRPGATPISVAEELKRLSPVVKTLLQANVPISIDTRQPKVMREMVAAGVDMVNDVEGFRSVESKCAILEADVTQRVALCAMHMQGSPLTMQDAPAYRSVVDQVQEFFYLTYKELVELGIAPHRIVLDPGIGFGKSVEHNILLVQHLKAMVANLPSPVATLVGLSRKSLIGALTGKAAGERQLGSVVGAIAAIQRGADIVRVHDVAATLEGLKVWQALAN
jgi:dihydropteroate synthase